MGCLLLAAHDPDTGDLIYIGDVGTGFSHAERQRLQSQLTDLAWSHPFAITPPREDMARARWVQPVLVGEVEYRHFTRGERGEGRLRHTSWRGLRHDRSIHEVTAPAARPRNHPVAAPATTTSTVATTTKAPTATNSTAATPASGKRATMPTAGPTAGPAAGSAARSVGDRSRVGSR